MPRTTRRAGTTLRPAHGRPSAACPRCGSSGVPPWVDPRARRVPGGGEAELAGGARQAKVPVGHVEEAVRSARAAGGLDEGSLGGTRRHRPRVERLACVPRQGQDRRAEPTPGLCHRHHAALRCAPRGQALHALTGARLLVKARLPGGEARHHVPRLRRQRVRHAEPFARDEVPRERPLLPGEPVPLHPGRHVAPADHLAHGQRGHRLVFRRRDGLQPQRAAHERHVRPQDHGGVHEHPPLHEHRVLARARGAHRLDDRRRLVEPHEDGGLQGQERVVAVVGAEVHDGALRRGHHSHPSLAAEQPVPLPRVHPRAPERHVGPRLDACHRGLGAGRRWRAATRVATARRGAGSPPRARSRAGAGAAPGGHRHGGREGRAALGGCAPRCR